jgi:Protein of unknown function (DUF3723)
MGRIDQETIRELQLLVPGGPDRTKVKGLVLSGEAFREFNQSERRSIWRVLRHRQEIIPSLYTFFKDLSYLEATASCLSRLLDLATVRQPTMYSGMKQIYNPVRHGRNDYPIQVSETEFRQCSGTVEEGRASGYRQLWLYAFRHYLQMPKPREKKHLAKAKSQEADERVVHRMACLAHQLGFDSPRIQKLIEESPDRRLALATLLKARERRRYQYQSIESLVSRMVACFDEAVPIELPSPHHSAPSSTISRTNRCGTPTIETHEQEREFLFLDRIEDPASEETVSALFIRRCVYFAFFGRRSESSPPVPADEDNLHRHSHSSWSPLFVLEEHHPPDGSPATEMPDVVTNEPGRGTGRHGRQHRSHRREKRQQQRRQERETRRRQRQERRRQRDRRQRTSSNSRQSADQSHSLAEGLAASSDRGAPPSEDLTEMGISEDERGSLPFEDAASEDMEERSPEAPDPSATVHVVAEPADQEVPTVPPENETGDDVVMPVIVVTEPFPEPESTMDGIMGTDDPLDAVVSPRDGADGDVVLDEEDDRLPEPPSSNPNVVSPGANRDPNLRPTERRRSRPSAIKKTAAQRRAAGLTQLNIVRSVKSRQSARGEPQESTSARSPTIPDPIDELMVEERAHALAQLEHSPTSPAPDAASENIDKRLREARAEHLVAQQAVDQGPDNIMIPEIVTIEPSPEHTPESTIDENTGLDDPLEAALLENAEDSDVYSRTARRRQSRPLEIKETAIARRRAAARNRLAGEAYPRTEVNIGREMKARQHTNREPEDSVSARSSTVLMAEARAHTLAQLEHRPVISVPEPEDHPTPPPAPDPPAMGEFIARLRESASPVDEALSDIGQPQSPGPIEETPVATAPEIVEPAWVPDRSDDDREARRKIPKGSAEEARLKQTAKKRVDNAVRAVEESHDDFTQTQAGDDLFSDDDENGGPAPQPDDPSASPGADHGSPSTLPRDRIGPKRIAKPARFNPFQHPDRAGQRNRPVTEFDMQRPDPGQTPTAQEDPGAAVISPIEKAPTGTQAPNHLAVPESNQAGVERRRKLANTIRKQRPPTPQARDVVIFRVWTRVRWTEWSRIVVDPSDPRGVEREAKRIVENHHAQLRDARMRNLIPSQCLQSAGQDGSHSVFMIFPDDKMVTEAMAQAAAEFMNPRLNRR